MKKFDLAQFDAVAFDIEGTLADTIPSHHLSRQEAFARHGYGHITRAQQELGPIYGSTNADVTGGILHAAGAIDKTVPFHEHPEVQKLVHAKDQIFKELALRGFEQMPGAIDFVQEIATRFPHKVALVTSMSGRYARPFMERFGLDKIIPLDFLVDGDLVDQLGLAHKPAPDPYRLAAQRLGAKRLLVFEDTVSGTEAAKRAGATVIALGFEPHNTAMFKAAKLAYPPDALAASYAEVRALLGLGKS
jgi:beta-phosphoglucomutase-like phosphatase (HAD superfamily)